MGIRVCYKVKASRLALEHSHLNYVCCSVTVKKKEKQGPINKYDL